MIFNMPLHSLLLIKEGPHDIQHNDTQQNLIATFSMKDTQLKGTEHKDTQHKYTQH
jgi:hypothetical protein